MFSRFFKGQKGEIGATKTKNEINSEDEAQPSLDGGSELNSIDDGSPASQQISEELLKHSADGDKSENPLHENPLLPEELCQIPTFANTKCCDRELIDKTRQLLEERYDVIKDFINVEDHQRMLVDDWSVSRFLLRTRLDPERACQLIEQCGRFRMEYKMGIMKPSDFPIEFYESGGMFRYAPDRVGNETIYMRVKMHRREPDLAKIMRSFILCIVEECDRANNGRGTAVVFDLTGCGLQNLDPGFLLWLLYSFRNYCPKGLSYIIVHNLPWILTATAKWAMSWLSETNRRRLRFTNDDGIRAFIAPENLPDYMGGTCKIDYRAVPEGCRPAEDTAEENNITRERARKIRKKYTKFLKSVDGDFPEPPPSTTEKKSKGGRNKKGGNKAGSNELVGNGTVAS